MMPLAPVVAYDVYDFVNERSSNFTDVFMSSYSDHTRLLYKSKLISSSS